MKDFEKIVLPMIVIGLITAIACYYILKDYNKQQAPVKKGTTEEVAEQIVSDEELKYETQGILIAKNQADMKLTFKSLDDDKQACFDYDGSTKVLAKHGNNMSIAQLELGDILDVTYSVHSGVLDSVQVSDDIWSQSDVTRFEVNEKRKTIEIAGSLYKLSDDVVVSYGQSLAKLMDVTNVDTLTIKGKDRKVYSIIVDEGHGYLRLLNDSYFLGGWVEVGQEIIKPVTESMLLPVPEGEYKLRITNRGYAGEDKVVIERDKETKVDLSKIDIEEVAIGRIRFNITPDYALLYVDDEMTDFDEYVPLEFGIHKVHVECAGHESVDTNIKVAADYADVTIELERTNGDSSSSSSSSLLSSASSSSTSSSSSSTSSTSSSTSSTASSSTSNSLTSSSTSTSMLDQKFEPVPSGLPLDKYYYSKSSSAKTTSISTSSSSTSKSTSSSTAYVSTESQLYIDGPVGAEVYVDGVYVGIAPIATVKSAGPHIVTLCANGYIPKSYTIFVENDDRDVTYSFSELISEGNYNDQVNVGDVNNNPAVQNDNNENNQSEGNINDIIDFFNNYGNTSGNEN